MQNSDGLIQLLTNPDSSLSSENPQWSQLLAPYLENALTHADSYSAEEISKHLDFFANKIGPHLGPGPVVSSSGDFSSYRPQYPSSMTNDLTPFELSLCWKEQKQQGKPIVRFVNDIIPSDAERIRSASLSQSLRLIDALQKVAEDESSGLTLHVLPGIWKAVSKCLNDAEPSIHPQGGCSQCGPSSVFIGFNLKQSLVSSKLYWLLPSCLDLSVALNLINRIFTACAVVHEFLASPVFLNSWHQIRDHVSMHPETLTLRMLSIDATAFPTLRIKIYVRCRFNGQKDFDAWEQHLRFNDSVTCPGEFRSMCRDLWTSLTTNPDEWTMSRPDTGPKYCLILYDLTASSSASSSSSLTANGVNELRQNLSSKLYVMCQEIPRPDSFIIAQLFRHCSLAADSSFLKAFATGTKPTNFISEIGLAPRKDGTEVSIYLSPSFFARRSWGVAEDGFMSKPRITLSS